MNRIYFIYLLIVIGLLIKRVTLRVLFEQIKLKIYHYFYVSEQKNV